jgi:hypothetical protein
MFWYRMLAPTQRAAFLWKVEAEQVLALGRCSLETEVLPHWTKCDFLATINVVG